jgi:RNA polymerase sigma factor (sigma-70 family)
MARERLNVAARPGLPGIETLYRRYGAWLRAALMRRFGTAPHDTDDVVQEAWLRLARYAPEAAARHPRALLLSIAGNLVRDDARRRVRRGATIAIDRLGDADTPAVMPEQIAVLALKETILTLPPVCRDVFVLSRFSAMTYEEIADHLGIAVKTVEWRMGKALAHCAAALGDEGTDERP